MCHAALRNPRSLKNGEICTCTCFSPNSPCCSTSFTPPDVTCSAARASSAPKFLIQANIVSLVASAALGEAVLFLSANSPVRLSGRRVALVRELSRVEVRRVLGLHEGCRVPERLFAGESIAVIKELSRAAEHGTQSAMHRLRPAYGLGLRKPAA